MKQASNAIVATERHSDNLVTDCHTGCTCLWRGTRQSEGWVRGGLKAHRGGGRAGG